MAIDKQGEGNRPSKLKSAAPKAAEERTGLKHGLSRLVLSTESEADFQALLDSYEAEHKPTTATEKALVEQLATTTWRLRRLHNIEAGLYKLNASNRDGSGHLSLVADGSDKALTILARQQARLERSFRNALRELQRMRSKRSVKVENQTVSAAAHPPHQQAQPVRQVSEQRVPIMTNIPRS
jgi:hypothetical protein